MLLSGLHFTHNNMNVFLKSMAFECNTAALPSVGKKKPSDDLTVNRFNIKGAQDLSKHMKDQKANHPDLAEQA